MKPPGPRLLAGGLVAKLQDLNRFVCFFRIRGCETLSVVAYQLPGLHDMGDEIWKTGWLEWWQGRDAFPKPWILDRIKGELKSGS